MVLNSIFLLKITQILLKKPTKSATMLMYNWNEWSLKRLRSRSRNQPGIEIPSSREKDIDQAFATKPFEWILTIFLK